jgi:hypothetical protein
MEADKREITRRHHKTVISSIVRQETVSNDQRVREKSKRNYDSLLLSFNHIEFRNWSPGNDLNITKYDKSLKGEEGLY